MRYRRKLIVIEAEQFNADDECWPTGVFAIRYTANTNMYAIDTLEGRYEVTDGDWIVTGTKGQRYPCKPDFFEATYEPVDDEPKGGER